MTLFTVPSPPAATNSRRPSPIRARISAAQSRSLLAYVDENDLAAAGAAVDAMPVVARAHLAVIVRYSAAHDKDPLLDIEAHTKVIVDWARQHGPFDALGIVVDRADPVQAAYAIKRLAVMAQGENAASRIVLPPMSMQTLNA